MMIAAYIVLGLYMVSLAYITVYCLFQFNLLYHYQRYKKIGASTTETVLETENALVKQRAMAMAGHDDYEVPANFEEEEEWPFVTIQLPVFNEMFVVERLVDTIAAFDYPKDRFEIHILDDSTDETINISKGKVEEYKAKGYNIELITRTDRVGYKAGALKHATPMAQGDFIAIFDADFMPKKEFLKKTIPHFKTDPHIGVVQTRWLHINEDYSLITQLQALQLNVHFTVEQTGRMAAGHFLQFNGTAGVWRKKTIEDAGGWEADTITEDLDLSIRAQMKGWKIKYLEEMGSPAELPVEMNSLKSQQFRWMKGGAETAKKMLPVILKSRLSLNKKIHSTIHLLASSIFLFVFLVSITSVPLLYFLGDLYDVGFSKNFFGIFLIGLLSVIAVYYVANIQAILPEERKAKYPFLKFIYHFPMFLSLSMGLGLHNSIAVWEGYRGKKSPFVRTPKFDIKGTKDKIKTKKYLNHKLSWTTILEGVLALYFIGAVAAALYWQNTTFIVFHLMLAIGYTTIFFYTIRDLKRY